MSGLATAGLGVRYGRRRALDGIDLGPIRRGEVVALVGPNAAGKSTLLKALAGLARSSGRITLDGLDLGRVGARERARKITYVPQDWAASAVLTVFESVLLAVKQDASWRVGDDDLERVERALARVGIAGLGGRWLAELSGGQRQMAALAQAVARGPDVLLLDEPTSALDLRHQLELLDLVRADVRERRGIALAALHDLNLAARFADRLAVIDAGRLVGLGAPAAVLTPALLADVYGIEGTVQLDVAGHPHVIPLRSLRAQGALAPG